MHRLNRTNDRVEKKNESPTTDFRSSSRKSAKRALEQTELAKCVLQSTAIPRKLPKRDVKAPERLGYRN
ncbi:hypothetical protein L5515_019250 [Caenorhabditis briggsae]|uniref:Uncharacterized protein n=1 Tax=Caenorhabditis briggsae TaxID=6238 RepID=A0AAE9FJE4_CAEBR|nr:hypothetical protein L5515_019250 [Caenorhabditis briggsae]